MLRNVIGDYLDSVLERDFDLPFISLLPSLGFYDIHFTHGQVEFGKDFIAKRVEENVTLQYSFQLKAGDIKQAEWRNSIMGQMLEAILSRISHPNFDDQLPHQSVLVTTGELRGNARLGFQDFNETVKSRYSQLPVIFWGKETLLDLLVEHGLEGIYHSEIGGLENYGNLFKIYGIAINGQISEKEVEVHSRFWLNESLSFEQILLGSALETELISRLALNSGCFYEAFHIYLSFQRVVLFLLSKSINDDEIVFLLDVIDQNETKLQTIGRDYVDLIKELWITNDKNMAKAVDGSGLFITYLVQMMRILEISGYLFFFDEEEKQEEIGDFIIELIKTEPGCAHIPSDWYAVSIVLPVLALTVLGKRDEAEEFLQRICVWLCDRYEDGIGLASIGETELEEITILLGYPFDFTSVDPRGSFLATLVSDLAAYLGNTSLYSDIVNDIKACKIFPNYWQPQDSVGIFSIEGADVIAYPNIEFSDRWSEFSSFNYAEHVKHEVKEYEICKLIAPFRFFSPLMLILRDRYFPSLWVSMV